MNRNNIKKTMKESVHRFHFMQAVREKPTHADRREICIYEPKEIKSLKLACPRNLYTIRKYSRPRSASSYQSACSQSQVRKRESEMYIFTAYMKKKYKKKKKNQEVRTNLPLSRSRRIKRGLSAFHYHGAPTANRVVTETTARRDNSWIKNKRT